VISHPDEWPKLLALMGARQDQASAQAAKAQATARLAAVSCFVKGERGQ